MLLLSCSILFYSRLRCSLPQRVHNKSHQAARREVSLTGKQEGGRGNGVDVGASKYLDALPAVPSEQYIRSQCQLSRPASLVHLYSRAFPQNPGSPLFFCDKVTQKEVQADITLKKELQAMIEKRHCTACTPALLVSLLIHAGLHLAVLHFPP